MNFALLSLSYHMMLVLLPGDGPAATVAQLSAITLRMDVLCPSGKLSHTLPVSWQPS